MSAWAIASPLAADANQGQPILEWFWPITQLQNRRLTISVRTCVAAIVVLMTVSAQNPAVHIREASTREKREPALKIATDRNPTQIISLLLVEPGKRTNRDLHRIPALKPSTSPFGVRTPKCRAQSFLVGAARVSSGNEGLGAGRGWLRGTWTPFITFTILGLRSCVRRGGLRVVCFLLFSASSDNQRF